MGKLRILSAREICRILAQYGFAEIRASGSHIVMQRRVLGDGGELLETITAVVPNHSEIAIGTLQSIIRQSRLPRSLFE